MATRIPIEVVDAIIDDYEDGILTAAEIAKKHDVCIRSVYNILEYTGVNRGRKENRRNMTIRLNKDEMETIVLLYLESADALNGKYRIFADRVNTIILDKLSFCE